MRTSKKNLKFKTQNNCFWFKIETDLKRSKKIEWLKDRPLLFAKTYSKKYCFIFKKVFCFCLFLFNPTIKLAHFIKNIFSNWIEGKLSVSWSQIVKFEDQICILKNVNCKKKLLLSMYNFIKHNFCFKLAVQVFICTWISLKSRLKQIIRNKVCNKTEFFMNILINCPLKY